MLSLKKKWNGLVNTQNEDCKRALTSIVEKYQANKIDEFIDNVPYIGELDKKFYKKYTHERYKKILLVAHDVI